MEINYFELSIPTGKISEPFASSFKSVWRDEIALVTSIKGIITRNIYLLALRERCRVFITIILVIFPGCEKNARRECQVFITIIGSTLRPLTVATRIKVKRRSRDFVGKTFLVRTLQWKCTRMEFHRSTRTARALAKSGIFLRHWFIYEAVGWNLVCRKVIKKLDSHRSLWASWDVWRYMWRWGA